MVALLIVVAVCFGLDAITDLYYIAKHQPVVNKPENYVMPFVGNIIVFAFVLYALLNWL